MASLRQCHLPSLVVAVALWPILPNWLWSGGRRPTTLHVSSAWLTHAIRCSQEGPQNGCTAGLERNVGGMPRPRIETRPAPSHSDTLPTLERFGSSLFPPKTQRVRPVSALRHSSAKPSWRATPLSLFVREVASEHYPLRFPRFATAAIGRGGRNPSRWTGP